MISCTAIAAALLAASPGATVSTGVITCPTRIIIRNVTREGVTLDATGASFPEGLAMSGTSGVRIHGGTYGSATRDTAAGYAIEIGGGADNSVSGATVLARFGSERGGIRCRATVRCTIRDNALSGHSTGISIYEATDFLVARNTLHPRKDGMNIAGSYRGIVASNTIHTAKRWGSDHPDGIQLWSLAGKPLQSDMWLVNNSVTGDTQGIYSTDPKTGSAERLHLHGNYVAVTFSHTISCSLCRDSGATDNVLSSYPGAYFGDMGGRLKGFDPARGNTVARNVIANGKVTLPPRVWWTGSIPISPGSRFDSRLWKPVGAVL